jgi:hypothetical protein
MNEAKIERLERTLWELEQLATELDDTGYVTFANTIDDIVTKIEIDIQAAIEELDNVA